MVLQPEAPKISLSGIRHFARAASEFESAEGVFLFPELRIISTVTREVEPEGDGGEDPTGDAAGPGAGVSARGPVAPRCPWSRCSPCCTGWVPCGAPGLARQARPPRWPRGCAGAVPSRAVLVVQESLVSEEIVHDLDSCEVTVEGEELSAEHERLEVDAGRLQQRMDVSSSGLGMVFTGERRAGGRTGWDPGPCLAPSP